MKDSTKTRVERIVTKRTLSLSLSLSAYSFISLLFHDNHHENHQMIEWRSRVRLIRREREREREVQRARERRTGRSMKLTFRLVNSLSLLGICSSPTKWWKPILTHNIWKQSTSPRSFLPFPPSLSLSLSTTKYCYKLVTNFVSYVLRLFGTMESSIRKCEENVSCPSQSTGGQREGENMETETSRRKS